MRIWNITSSYRREHRGPWWRHGFLLLLSNHSGISPQIHLPKTAPHQPRAWRGCQPGHRLLPQMRGTHEARLSQGLLKQGGKGRTRPLGAPAPSGDARVPRAALAPPASSALPPCLGHFTSFPEDPLLTETELVSVACNAPSRAQEYLGSLPRALRELGARPRLETRALQPQPEAAPAGGHWQLHVHWALNP